MYVCMYVTDGIQSGATRLVAARMAQVECMTTTARDWLVATSHGCWQGYRYKSYGPHGHWALRGGKLMRDCRASRKTVIKLVAS